MSATAAKKDKYIHRSLESICHLVLPRATCQIPRPPIKTKGKLEMTFQKFAIPNTERLVGEIVIPLGLSNRGKPNEPRESQHRQPKEYRNDETLHWRCDFELWLRTYSGLRNRRK